MLVLAVAALRRDETPTVVEQHPQYMSLTFIGPAYQDLAPSARLLVSAA